MCACSARILSPFATPRGGSASSTGTIRISARICFFGRNEECDIRCVYHGWKFDVDGNCNEFPSEPPDSSFREKVRLTAYPTTIRGGVLWAYMGPADKKGEVPHFDWMDLPETHIYRSRWTQECN